MKKFVGFGVMLALIVVPVAVAQAQNATVNLFPIAMGTFAGHDTYLAVTNLAGQDFLVEPEEDNGDANPIIIRSASQGGTVMSAESDLLEGETRVYASNSSVNPRNFGCTNDICTVTVCAPAEPPITPLVLENGDGDIGLPAAPAISSALFWLSNGQFYAITTPILLAGSIDENVCTPAFGVPGTTTPPVVIP